MSFLATCDSPFSLDELANQIRKSSNFRFAWQFYSVDGIDPQSEAGARKALDSIIAIPSLHQFLRDSFEPVFDDSFVIEPLHEHCRCCVASEDFENTLASAANDLLGAYSRTLRPATNAEKQEIARLFGSLGPYHPFELCYGTEKNCPTCNESSHHLFTTWFYGVAWDWCLLAFWPNQKILWVGCLTDTD
jgi:hypothetical protein